MTTRRNLLAGTTAALALAAMPRFAAAGDDTDLVESLVERAGCGENIEFPARRLVITRPLTLDLRGNAVKSGATLVGAGLERTILDMRAVQTDPAFLVTGPGDSFYLTMKDFSIWGELPGAVLQIGDNNCQDHHNEAQIDLLLKNYASSINAVGIRLNSVLNADLRLVANCERYGTGITCRQTQFSRMFGSSGTQDGYGMRLTHGYTYGNVFQAMDFENVQYCVVIDSPTAVRNTFIGGQFSYSRAGVSATAGNTNCFINPNPAPFGGAGVGSLFNPGASVGLQMWP